MTEKEKLLNVQIHNLCLVMYLVLPYLEWLERGDDPKDLDAIMAEDLPNIIGLVKRTIGYKD